MPEQSPTEAAFDGNISPELQQLEMDKKSLTDLQAESEVLAGKNMEKEEQLEQGVKNMLSLVTHITEEIRLMEPQQQRVALERFNALQMNIASERSLLFRNKKISKVLEQNTAAEILASTATLSSAPAGVPPEQVQRAWYRAQFPSDSALVRIGLGDMLPPEDRFVLVWKNDSSEPILGRRAITVGPHGNERIGYVDQNNQYITIVNGEHFLPARELQQLFPAGELQIPREFKRMEELGEFPNTQDESNYKKSYIENLEATELLEVYFSMSNPDLKNLEQEYGKELPPRFRERLERIEKNYPYLQNKETAQEQIPLLSASEILAMRSDLGGPGVMKQIFETLGLLDVIVKDELSNAIEKQIVSLRKENPGHPLLTVFGEKGLQATLMALGEHESMGFRKFAISGTGAMGPFQFIRGNVDRLNINPFHLEQAVEGVIQLWTDNFHDVFQNVSLSTEQLQERFIIAHYAGAERAVRSDTWDAPNVPGDRYNQTTPRQYLRSVQQKAKSYLQDLQ